MNKESRGFNEPAKGRWQAGQRQSAFDFLKGVRDGLLLIVLCMAGVWLGRHW
ncbi:MAG: hypothetical protein OSA97_06775 [Nevskia sp.]|nr:hypothetical protein [Nevskia sp.]